MKKTLKDSKYQTRAIVLTLMIHLGLFVTIAFHSQIYDFVAQSPDTEKVEKAENKYTKKARQIVRRNK